MKRQMEMWRVFALVCLVTGVSAIQAFADGVPLGSGPPYTITQDTQLSGDVDCSGLTSGQACITFGMDDIQLDLNGHTVTGPGSTSNVNGVDTNTKNGVKIEGPGKVEKFDEGIFVNGSTQCRVRRIVVIRNNHGIDVDPADQNEIEDNIVLNNNSGIFIEGAQNDVQKNEVHGNDDYGILILNTATGNQIENNSVTTNGNSGIRLTSGTSDNTVNENIVLNNSSEDIEDDGSGVPWPNTVTQKNVCEKGTGAAANVCHNSPTPWFHIGGVEVRTSEEEQHDEEHTAKENSGSWEVRGNGTLTEPLYWLWATAYAGALPLLPSPPLPTLP